MLANSIKFSRDRLVRHLRYGATCLIVRLCWCSPHQAQTRELLATTQRASTNRRALKCGILGCTGTYGKTDNSCGEPPPAHASDASARESRLAQPTAPALRTPPGP